MSKNWFKNEAWTDSVPHGSPKLFPQIFRLKVVFPRISFWAKKEGKGIHGWALREKFDHLLKIFCDGKTSPKKLK